MKPHSPSMIGFLAACVLWALQLVAAGGPAGDLVARGNAAYADGRFDEALTLYDEASVTMPESPRLYFNRGAVRYRMEDYAAATEDFKEAAVRAKEPALTSRAKYNLGNCAFRQAQRQRDSDLKKAVEHCQESIAYFQEARDLDSEYREAAENIEIVRLFVKVLLDEQKKKEEEQQQQQEEQENLVQKLQKLIKRQHELIGKNGRLRINRPDPADALTMEAWHETLQALAGEQGTLRTDTGAVLDEMRQTASQIRQQAAAAGAQGAPPQQGNPADAAAFAEKLDAAAGHVVNAMTDEQQAQRAMTTDQQETALSQQASAVRNLEEAVKELADDQQQDQQQQSGDQDQQDQEQEQEQEQQDQQDQQDGEQEQEDQEQQEQQEQQDEQEQDPQDSQDQQQDQQSEQEEMEARAERVEDILDEEKENQKQRQPVRPGRGRPVDKDW